MSLCSREAFGIPGTCHPTAPASAAVLSCESICMATICLCSSHKVIIGAFGLSSFFLAHIYAQLSHYEHPSPVSHSYHWKPIMTHQVCLSVCHCDVLSSTKFIRTMQWSHQNISYSALIRFMTLRWPALEALLGLQATDWTCSQHRSSLVVLFRVPPLPPACPHFCLELFLSG